MDPTPRQPDPANPQVPPPPPAAAGASPAEPSISDAELTPSPEVIAALAELYGQVPTPPPGFDAAVIAEGQTVIDQAQQTKLVAWWRRPRTVAALATAAGLAVVATASFLALPGTNPPSSPKLGKSGSGAALNIASAKDVRIGSIPPVAAPTGANTEIPPAGAMESGASKTALSATDATPAVPSPSGKPSTGHAPIGQHGMFDAAPPADADAVNLNPPPSPSPTTPPTAPAPPAGPGAPRSEPNSTGTPTSTPPPAPPASMPAAGAPITGGGNGAGPTGSPITVPPAPRRGTPASTPGYGGAPAQPGGSDSSGAPAPARAKASAPPDVVDALRAARFLAAGKNNGSANSDKTPDESALLLILDLDGLAKLEPKHVDELLRRSVQLATHPIRTGALPAAPSPRGIRIAIAWNTPSLPGGSR